MVGTTTLATGLLVYLDWPGSAKNKVWACHVEGLLPYNTWGGKCCWQQLHVHTNDMALRERGGLVQAAVAPFASCS